MLAKRKHDVAELDMDPFFETQSNPVHEYLVLNRTRKLCNADYSNADF